MTGLYDQRTPTPSSTQVLDRSADNAWRVASDQKIQQPSPTHLRKPFSKSYKLIFFQEVKCYYFRPLLPEVLPSVGPTYIKGWNIDVKNINLQIKKNIKNMFFFHFYKKNIKNMDKNIKLHYPFKYKEAPSI